MYISIFLSFWIFFLIFEIQYHNYLLKIIKLFDFVFELLIWFIIKKIMGTL